MTLASGIALRLAATALFSGMSLCVRLASFEAPVGQIVFWRSAVALVPRRLVLLAAPTIAVAAALVAFADVIAAKAATRGDVAA